MRMTRHFLLLTFFMLSLPPQVRGNVVNRAAERFRDDVNTRVEQVRGEVNRVNPFYRLTTNIYHWNYKFSQPKRGVNPRHPEPETDRIKKHKHNRRSPGQKS